MKVRQLTWIPAMSSLVMLTLIVGLAVHLRLGLGHWPKPMVESYDSELFSLHEFALLWVGCFAVFVALPLWGVAMCFPEVRSPARTGVIQVGCYFAGWVLILVFMKVDYGNFVTWFLD